MERSDARVSMLIELKDEPGSLEAALHVFSRHKVNLTHIESRPATNGRFDFYVDCEGQPEDDGVTQAIGELEQMAEKLMVLDTRTVPWFPRHISELDEVTQHVLSAGIELDSDHPGFNDPVYRERRAFIDRLALDDRFGMPFPVVEYTASEIKTWSAVYSSLESLHEKYACRAYLDAKEEMKQAIGFGSESIPQGCDVSEFLMRRTGFRLRPVPGLLSSRDFLNGLAFRVFFSTQYIRHPSVPQYTPEPDICHELIGHAPMFADPEFADLSQEIGLASLGASDSEIERLARCYWFSVEFGLVREEGELKAFGAGILSSPGEIAYACEQKKAEYRDWDPSDAADQDFPITDYQPVYFVAKSLRDSRERMQAFARNLQRPFYARYNPMTHRIWVDRSVNRAEHGR